MDADTGHGDFIKETSSRKWFQRRPPDSLDSASKFSKFKFFGLRKSVTEVVNIARKETTVPIRNSCNYDTLEEKSGKENYKCKTRKENRKRGQPSRSPPLIPTCTHAVRGRKNRPNHKDIPSFGSKESLPITKGEINFTRVRDDDSSDMLLQRQIDLPTRSALLDVEDLFGKVSTLRERLKTFEMKVRDSEAAVDEDGPIQLKIFDKPLYSNNNNSKNYRRVSMDASALSPIKEQAHPSRSNIKSDCDEDAVASSSPSRRKDKSHSTRSKRPLNNETQTHPERYKKDSSSSSARSKDRKPVFSKRFFQPEVPLELNEGITEKKSERIQCSISKLKSECTATSAEIFNKDCQTQCKCIDCKSGCIRMTAGVNTSSQHILKNNYQKQITQQRVLNVINYDSDKDVDESDKFTETVTVPPDHQTKSKRIGTRNESDVNLDNNVPKIIKDQSNKYKLKQIGSNSSEKYNNCRCAIGRADGLFACIEDLALCAEDLQRRILLLEERTCYCPNNNKSIKEFFRQTATNQPSTSFDNVSTQVSKNYTKSYDSSPAIRSPNTTSSNGYDRGELYMECKDPCPAYRQIGTEMKNYGVAPLDRNENDPEACHCKGKGKGNNCCYGVEIELAKQKQEMAEMLALMNDCMARYRNITDNVNSVQQTVDQFAETGNYFKPKTCDKFSCPDYVTRNLGSQTINMKTSQMRTCGSGELCPNKPGVRIQEKVEILEQRLQKMEMAAKTESDESSTSCFGRRKKKKKKKKEEKRKAKMKKKEEKKRREENKREEKRRQKAAKNEAKRRRKMKPVKSAGTVTDPAQSSPSSTSQTTEVEDQERRTQATVVDNRPLICKCKKAILRISQDYQ